jgi:hypothetical protein
LFFVVRHLPLALVCAIAFLALTSTAFAKKIEAQRLAALKRVGVISVAGDSLVDRRFALTVLGNREGVHDVADWNLGAIWQGQLETALEEKGLFEVVPLSADDRAEFNALIDLEKPELVIELIKSTAREKNLDGVLVFSNANTDQYFAEIYLEKFGIFQHKLPFKNRTYYYVCGRLFLFDAAGDQMDSQYFLGPKATGLSQVAYTRAPDDVTDVPFENYSPEQKEALKASLIDVTKPEWVPALEKLLQTK